MTGRLQIRRYEQKMGMSHELLREIYAFYYIGGGRKDDVLITTHLRFYLQRKLK